MNQAHGLIIALEPGKATANNGPTANRIRLSGKRGGGTS
ncbi:hypothetical protein AK972_0967 [Pseudomonas yamanorum]|nr:hypothetical protein AK972_0967 [Pseudomonas yamanorum]